MCAAQPIIAHVSMDPQLAKDIENRVYQVEQLLQEHLSGGKDFVTDKVTYLMHAGGKRFRAVFTLLCGQFSPHKNDKLITAAAIIELIHLATLYHDDVMDEARMRRGTPSVNARWNNTIAILAGDYLFAKVSLLIADLGIDVLRYLSDTVSTLVTGQLREAIGANGSDPIEHYLSVISEKTASLISASGYLAGHVCELGDGYTELLSQLGHAIGMAFQISDDIIDIASPANQSGKTPGTDLREGVFTLPVLYALSEENPIGQQLRQELTGPVIDEDRLQLCLNLLESSQGIAKAKEMLAIYVDQALNIVEKFPTGAAHDALTQLICSTIARVG